MSDPESAKEKRRRAFGKALSEDREDLELNYEQAGADADSLVLGTVNAPYMRQVSAEQLVAAILTIDVDWRVHLATLFTDVRPALVISFAERHGVDRNMLKTAYISIRDNTGERSVAFELAIGI